MPLTPMMSRSYLMAQIYVNHFLNIIFFYHITLSVWYILNSCDIQIISPHCCIYVSMNQVNIGSDNGLAPVWCQAVVWTNVGLLSIGYLGTNFSEILIKITKKSFMKMYLKIPSVKWRPFCPGEDELIISSIILQTIESGSLHALYPNMMMAMMMNAWNSVTCIYW